MINLNRSLSPKAILLSLLGCLILIPIAIVVLNAMGDFFVSFDEVERVTSPDGRNDAVIVEINGGAASAFGYGLYLLPSGCSIKRHDEPFSWFPEYYAVRFGNLYGAQRNESAWGVDLRWLNPHTIAVEYFKASSGAIKKTVTLNGQKFIVINKPGILNQSAPSGGMLYNLELEQKQRVKVHSDKASVINIGRGRLQ